MDLSRLITAEFSKYNAGFTWQGFWDAILYCQLFLQGRNFRGFAGKSRN